MLIIKNTTDSVVRCCAAAEAVQSTLSADGNSPLTDDGLAITQTAHGYGRQTRNNRTLMSNMIQKFTCPTKLQLINY